MPGVSFPVVPPPGRKANMQGIPSPASAGSLHAREVQPLPPAAEPGPCPSNSTSTHLWDRLSGTNPPPHNTNLNLPYSSSLVFWQRQSMIMEQRMKRARDAQNPPPPQGQLRPETYLNVDDDDSEDDEGLSVEDESEDELDILKACTRALGLSIHYASDWTSKDAFREFYQNWKDAIIASFDIEPRSFKLVMRETPTQIQYLAPRPQLSTSRKTSQELLGFIRFKKRVGSLEFTNFKAALSIEHLSLGGTSKRGQDRFAGTHGEGFKIASLVLHRENRGVHIASSSYYWNFGFRGATKSNFHCRISQPKPEVIQKKRNDFIKRKEKGARRGLTSNIWEDVTVKISKGRGIDGRRISEAEFRSWLQVSLDIQGPKTEDIVHTEHGDLIVDKQFAGRIYLKGLRVPGPSSAVAEFGYGYNFVRGRINRDRQRLTDEREEAKMLALIWEHSISKEGHKITDNYIALFREDEDRADIALANETMPKSVAKVIWSRLRSLSPDSFFYAEAKSSDRVTNNQANIIVMDLKKRPEKLPKLLWKILTKFNLARTPDEERTHQFANSEAVEIGDDPFAISIKRAFKSCLALNHRTSGINIQIVSGGNTEIDVLFGKDENLLRIHQKCFNFEKIHKLASCDVFRLTGGHATEEDTFLCDHAVEDLFESALKNISDFLEFDPVECVLLRRLARERIQQIPRSVTVSKTGRANELTVLWAGNESEMVSKRYGANIQYRVTLHRMSTCRQLRDELLYQNDKRMTPLSTDTSQRAHFEPSTSCDCAFQIAPRTNTKAVFVNLDHRENYFPMVARIENNSFFGIPPSPIAPRATSVAISFAVAPASSPRLAFSPSLQMELDEDNSIEPFPNDVELEDVEMDIQTFPRSETNNAKSPSQRPNTMPCGTDTQNQSSTAHNLACNNDMKLWQAWQDQELPGVFARLIPERRTEPSKTSPAVSSLKCHSLDYTFKKDEYCHIRSDYEAYLEFVILIHDIHCENDDSYYLLVTKYSFMRATTQSPSQSHFATQDADISCKELLLHFGEYKKMGTLDDAEIIRVDDITHAEDIAFDSSDSSDGVDHLPRIPTDLESCGLFCRFAVQSSSNSKEACFTPIASSLLHRKDRWKQKTFIYPPKPIVFDLTPNVLGPSEGFSQEGYAIHSGIGFDPVLHGTWKNRHPDSEIYDGSPIDVFDQWSSGKLTPPCLPPTEHPRIALIAGENESFRLSDGNSLMPSIAQFLNPLDIMDAATKSTLKPDFLVLMMPPALLHSSTSGRLLSSIISLLQQRFSVHIKLCPLQEHGIPQERNILLIIASPLCDLLPWSMDWPTADTPPSVKILDIIGDLNFKNIRTNEKGEGGLVCSVPNEYTCDADNPGEWNRHIYNHQTGHATQSGETLDMNATSVSLSHITPLIHPVRRDVLTVRELARLQGFNDKFLIMGTVEAQYHIVLKAMPPSVPKLVAKTLFRVFCRSRMVELRNSDQTPRGIKRPRLNSVTKTT